VPTAGFNPQTVKPIASRYNYIMKVYGEVGVYLHPSLRTRQTSTVNFMLQLLKSWEGTQVLLNWKAGWTPGPVVTGAKNLMPPLGLNRQTLQPIVSPYTHDMKVYSGRSGIASL